MSRVGWQGENQGVTVGVGAADFAGQLRLLRDGCARCGGARRAVENRGLRRSRRFAAVVVGGADGHGDHVAFVAVARNRQIERASRRARKHGAISFPDVAIRKRIAVGVGAVGSKRQFVVGFGSERRQHRSQSRRAIIGCHDDRDFGSDETVSSVADNDGDDRSARRRGSPGDQALHRKR